MSRQSRQSWQPRRTRQIECPKATGATARRMAWRERSGGAGVSGGVGIAVLLVVLLGVLGGCEAQNQLKAGDRAMELGSYASAVSHYETALRLSPNWSEDAPFMAKLRRARHEKAYAAGQRFLEAEQWQAAIDHFESALALAPDPTGTPGAPGEGRVERALLEAKHGAAQQQYHRAMDAASGGDLAVAEAALRQALSYEPEHAGARQALRSLESLQSPGAYPHAEVVQAYQRGESLTGDKRWSEALEQFRQTIASDGNYLPARAAAAEADRQLAQARELYDQAVIEAGDKQLDRAIESLEQVLNIWPHHPKAAPLLDEVRQRRDEADRLAEQADEAISQERWDEALAAAEQARAIFADHSRANELAPTARDRAALAHWKVGQSHLEAGQLTEAHQAFNEALRYRPEHEAARRGLAEVARDRAAAAEQAGRLGHALLFYMQANEHEPTAPGTAGREQIASLRQLLAEEVAFTVALDADHSDRTIAAESASFLPKLRSSLARRAPHFLDLDVVASGVGGAGDAGLSFVAEVHVLAVEVDEQLTRSEGRVHRYEVRYKVANPRIPRLESAVRVQQHTLNHQRARYDRLRERYRRAQRHRSGHDENHDHDDHERYLRRLRRDLREADDDLDDAEDDLRVVKRALLRAPATVTESQEESWPYARETYQKTGRMIVRVALRGSDEATPDAPPVTVEETFTRSDTTITHPNPDIGLRADPLELPDDQAVRRRLAEDAAQAVAARMVREAVDARATTLRRRAEQLEADAQMDQALELRVQALVLRRAVDLPGAERELRRLAATLSRTPQTD